MAGESSQTIDRIQVEIAVNTADVTSGLQSVESQIDATKTKLGTLEHSSSSASKGMDNLNSAASSSVIAFDECNSAMLSADKTLTTVTKYIPKTAENMKEVGVATMNATMKIDAFTDIIDVEDDKIDWIPEAASNMGEMATKTGTLADKATNAKKMIGALKGGLAGLGITAGITAIIDKFNEMAKAAQDANDAYDEIKKNLISYTGELNEDQLQMVDSIYVNSEDSTGFTDRDQVTKAVGSVVTLWKDASADAQKEIATELSTLQALGRISDTGSFAETAKGTFSEWSIGSNEAASSMEYLYYVSQQTGVGMEEMASFMTDNADTLQKMGYSFSQSANLIGSSWNSVGSMKDLDSLISGYTTNYESKLDQLTTAWEEANEDMTMDDATQKKLEAEAEEWAIAQAKAYGAKLPSALKEAQANAISSGEAWENIVLTDRDTSEKIRENTAEYNAVNNPTNAFEISASNYEKERNNIQTLLQKYGQEGLFGMNVNYWAQQLASFNDASTGEGIGKSYEEVVAEIKAKYGDEPIELSAELTADKTATEEALEESVPENIEVPVTLTPTTDETDTSIGKSEETGIDTSSLGDTIQTVADGVDELGTATDTALGTVQTFTSEATDPLDTSFTNLGGSIAGVLEQDTVYIESLPTLQTALDGERISVDTLTSSYWRLYEAKKAAAEA